MNTKKIESTIEARKITKAKLAEQCNITRRTLDNVLNGADAKISTVEALASALGVTVGYFFEEEVKINQRQAGRDYVEKGKIEHKGPEYNGASGGTVSDLEKENAELKSKLIAAQAQIIDLLNKK